MSAIAKEGYMSELKKITEQTLVPISLVIILFGGVFWITNIWSSVETLKKDFTEQRETTKQAERDTNEKFDKIMNELYYLKGAVNGAKQKKGD
jgi:hypothetical protein